MSLTEAQIERNEKNIATLLPEVQNLCRRHLGLCASQGIDLLVVQALRTKEQQDALYAQGRTAPGKIVTNAKFGYSYHCYGMAYDVAIFKTGQVVWSGPEYVKIGALGKTLGLTWGGDFKSIAGDVGHFQFSGGKTLAALRAEYGIA